MSQANTKSPLQIILEVMATHRSGTLHVDASNNDCSNVHKDRVTFYHNKAPATPIPPMEPTRPPPGCACSVDLRQGCFQNIGGSERIFHLQDTVSTDMQAFFERLAAGPPSETASSPRQDPIRTDTPLTEDNSAIADNQ